MYSTVKKSQSNAMSRSHGYRSTTRSLRARTSSHRGRISSAARIYLARAMARKLAGAVLAALLFAGGAGAYPAENVGDGGTIGGTVKYAGPLPTPAGLQVTKDRDVCGTRIDDPSLVIGHGR